MDAHIKEINQLEQENIDEQNLEAPWSAKSDNPLR